MGQYTVQPGDTLWGIAQDQCGDGSLWPKILSDNKQLIGIPSNLLIRPGQVLWVDCPSSPGIWYEVEPGDNLTRIAEKICGNDNWQKIYNDNKDVIGDNPNLIAPGQVLCVRC
jgi:nucleoid-associated protein YgaU